ncbi:hypothetical protein PVK06_020943 [Gossypium arboreum]|uniref:Uncharacterized protein n=1 Tax=Gossypium arboreum TaxID=29729 RepID=A0ABR0PNP7_GOSAR|nr:hypothetical protein PVK06_020943 [Gossypium arboreum]
MLRTHHSSFEHPVISPLELPILGSCELLDISSSEHPDRLSSYICCGHTLALMSIPIKELSDMVLCELPDYDSYEFPVI